MRLRAEAERIGAQLGEVLAELIAVRRSLRRRALLPMSSAHGVARVAGAPND